MNCKLVGSFAFFLFVFIKCTDAAAIPKINESEISSTSTFLRRLRRSDSQRIITDLRGRHHQQQTLNRVIEVITNRSQNEKSDFNRCIYKYHEHHQPVDMLSAFKHCFAQLT